MSIVKASGLALQAQQRARAAAKAARVCDEAAMAIVSETEDLIRQADAERAKQAFAGDPIQQKLQLEIDNKVRDLLQKARTSLDEARADIEQCRRAKRAICIANEALKAARRCDIGRARRLAETSRVLDDTIDATFKKKIRNFPVGGQLGAALKSLKQIEKLRRECAKRRPIYQFEEGGTFEDSKAGLAPKGEVPLITEGQRNRIELEFRPIEEQNCDSVCLVQVQHFEDLTDCGAVVEIPGKVRRAGPGGLAPDDADAVDGYVVDTSPGNKCPCFPPNGQKFVKVVLKKAGGGTTTARGISGLDEANDVKGDFELHFETAAVCFKVTKTDPETKEILDYDVTILQTMRWVLRKDENDDLKTTILLNGGKIDWGPPSRPFQKALSFWLKQEGRGPCPANYLQKKAG